jgi:hypothetical protein
VFPHKRRAAAALLAAALMAAALLAALLAGSCSLGGYVPAGKQAPPEPPAEEEEEPATEDPATEDPATEDPAAEDPEDPAQQGPDRGSLDPRLYGLWRFSYSGKVMEEIEIAAPADAGASGHGSFTYRGILHSASLAESFAGDIVYAENFSDKTGVLIVEYWPGHKQVWIDWGASFYPTNMVPLDPQPPGNFYGVYFLRLNEAGAEVLLACTSDQANAYGPTEAATLEEAVARFTEENRELWMHLSVGDPQQKVEEGD